MIDAEHTADFAKWYQYRILERVRPCVPVLIHDWLPGRPQDWNTEEAACMDEWMTNNPGWTIWHAFGNVPDSGLASTWIYKI